MRRTAFLALLLASVCLARYDALSVSGEWMIGAYKAALSPLQGTNVCNFQPTCSQFARAAIRSQGFLPGVLIGADRLMRCNTIAWSYYDTYYRGDVVGSRMPDPVENHVAWRNPPGEPGLAVRAEPSTTGGRENTRGPAIPNVHFADYLYSSGDYYQAAGEYLRVRFTSSPRGLGSYAGLMAGESFLQAGDLAQARHAFRDLDVPVAHDFRQYGLARADFAAADYVGTRSILASITSPVLTEQSRALTGWTYFRQHRFSEGASAFSAGTDEPSRHLASMDGHDIRRRSRLASTLLSVFLPGSGQAYAGRAGDGAYSFLTVASIGLVTLWFADKHETHDANYLKVSIFGVITAIFYAGNVYGANIAARDYNLLQEHRYVQRADSLLGLMSLAPDYHVLLDSVPSDTALPGHE